MYILEVSYGCPSEKYPQNGIFQLDQAKALQKAGHRVVFAALDMRSLRRRRTLGLSFYEKDTLPVVEYSLPLGNLSSSLLRGLPKRAFAKLFAAVCRRYGRPDLLHVHFGQTAVFVADLCKQEALPYVITEHSSGLDTLKEDSRRFADLQTAYAGARGVIAVSSSLAATLQTRFGVAATVIPNVVDFSLFHEDLPRNPLPFTYVSAAMMRWGKGFDLLVPAFAKLLTVYPDSRLLILGDGEERKNTEWLASSLGVADKITFFGAYLRRDFARLLPAAHAFVLPSRHETFGVVYAEALGCGLPVIATRCGGPEDFVNEENGVLVPCEDVDALFEAMKKIQETQASYDRNSIATAAKEKFCDTAVASQITAFFERCL